MKINYTRPIADQIQELAEELEAETISPARTLYIGKTTHQVLLHQLGLTEEYYNEYPTMLNLEPVFVMREHYLDVT